MADARIDDQISAAQPVLIKVCRDGPRGWHWIDLERFDPAVHRPWPPREIDAPAAPRNAERQPATPPAAKRGPGRPRRHTAPNIMTEAHRGNC